MLEVREWSRSDTARLFRVPGETDDKYSRGVVGLRTGSAAYPGAAVLGVEAAWRSGAGYVRYTGPDRAADAVLARRPETVIGQGSAHARVDAWVVGSGTDPAERTDAEAAALREILAGPARVVVDAGALDLAPGSRAPFLVTPHAGEFSRLQARLRLTATGDAADDVVQAAAKLDATVLLKGARTLIATPGRPAIAVTAGTGWLATAGTGDVLAGILGTLIAAHPDEPLSDLAAAGAWLHGYAARLAAGALGDQPGHPIVALDVAEALPRAIADLLS